MEINQILLRPLNTEKTKHMYEETKCAVFKVHPDANKHEIKEAVQELFDVRVEKVTVVRRRPLKRERQGRVVGHKPGWKKAYVKLAFGEKINLFEDN